MHEFERFLAKTLGSAIWDVQLRLDDGARIIRIGELRGGEERNILVYMELFCMEYSYMDSSADGECIRTGKIAVDDDFEPRSGPRITNQI